MELEDLARKAKDNLAVQFQKTTQWFRKNMPPEYLEKTPKDVQLEHLVEITSRRLLVEDQVTAYTNENKKMAFVIAPGKRGSGAVKIIPHLQNMVGKAGNIFLSKDSKMSLATINSSPFEPVGEHLPQRLQEIYKEMTKTMKSTSDKKDLQVFLQGLDKTYAKTAEQRKLQAMFRMVTDSHRRERTYVRFSQRKKDQPHQVQVDSCMAGVDLSQTFRLLINLVTRYHFVLHYMYGVIVQYKGLNYLLFHMAIVHPKKQIDESSEEWRRVLKGVKSIPYIDHNDGFTPLLAQANPKSLSETNLVRAIANWVHVFLSEKNPYYFSLDRVSNVLMANPKYIDYAIQYFRTRFDPYFGKDRQEKAEKLRTRLRRHVNLHYEGVDRAILAEGINFISHILKTNYFVISKSGLCFRMDPKVLDPERHSTLPYGFFFLIGRNYRCFHVRYRHIARGGFRIVMPATAVDYENGLATLFHEANGLAFAQQLKNKDIPEGGAKAVLLLRPGANRSLAVKAAISSLLDVITEDPTISGQIIDYYKREELIFLGPDENMTNDIIHWVTEHAKQRGYSYPAAVISSKPDLGINHKEYGVTSEGVGVFLDNALKHLELDRKETFSIKITGGPDGDVAGNILKILHREYGEQARVVAIADGFGAAYDPHGLNWGELLRLVAENRSIQCFRKNHLSHHRQAFVVTADNSKDRKIRNELHNRYADVFIPAGGRPYTVNDHNVQKFLDCHGHPSCQVIVEGANIFFSNKARKKIVAAGVTVFKDSSANKGGVICSSLEIMASILLTDAEFRDIRDVYAKQCIDMLKSKADLEAKTLLAEYVRRGKKVSLVELSLAISQEINRAKDIFQYRIQKMTDEQLHAPDMTFAIHAYVPPVLVETFRRRINEKLPRSHRVATISAYLASRLVYREGLNWLDTMSDDQVFEIGLEYLRAEQSVNRIIENIDSSNLPHKNVLKSILHWQGAKHIAVKKIKVA